MSAPNEVQHVSGQSNKPISKPAHCLDRDSVVQELSANKEDGLTVSEAKQRLEDYGRNELDDGPGVQPLKILLRQVANAMMLVELTGLRTTRNLMLTNVLGPHSGHGCITGDPVVDRGRCYCWCHHPQYRGWILPRIQCRENDGLLALLELPYGQRGQRWPDRQHSYRGTGPRRHDRAQNR